MPFHYIVPSHSTTLDSLYVCAAMCRLLIYLLTYLVSYVLNSIFMFCKKKKNEASTDYYFNSTGNTIEIVVIEFPLPNVRDSIDKFCKSSLFRRC